MKRLIYTFRGLQATAVWMREVVRLTYRTALIWDYPNPFATNQELREWKHDQETNGLLRYEWQHVRELRTKAQWLLSAAFTGKLEQPQC